MNNNKNSRTILLCSDTKNMKNLHLLIANAHIRHVVYDSCKHYVKLNLGIRWVGMGWFCNKLDPVIFNRQLRLNCSSCLFVAVSSERIGNQSYTMNFSISRKMCKKSLVIYGVTLMGWEEQLFLCVNCNLWLPSRKKPKPYFCFCYKTIPFVLYLLYKRSV